MITEHKFKSSVNKPVSTNHVFVIDVSGSMYNALPKIKTHLKNNLSLLVKEQDTVSILYFASKGQFGTVFAGKQIGTLSDLTEINNALDRYLHTMGCTGFVEPLELAVKTVSEINNSNINSLIFMTDGYDNQWPEKEILAKCEKLNNAFESVTFLEYGYYCNRALLEKMTSIVNGQHLFTESYDEYEPIIEKSLSVTGYKLKELEITDSSTHIIYLDNGQVMIKEVINNKVSIPEHITNVVSLNKDVNIDDVVKLDNTQLVYMICLYARKIENSELVFKILNSLGDIALFNKFTNCFTKQDYSTFDQLLSDCVFDESARFVDGVADYDLVPREDAFTIVDLLNLLSSHGAYLDLNAPEFNYNKIGRSTEQKKVSDTQEQLMNEYVKATPERKEEILNEMKDTINGWDPEFVDASNGLAPINRIVLNSNRPNISVGTTKVGYLSVPLYVQEKYKLPDHLDVIMHRTYNIVKDGIVNMKKLPIKLDSNIIGLLSQLCPECCQVNEYNSTRYLLLDLTKLPLINRNMVQPITSLTFFKSHFDLERLKAKQKVFKYYLAQVNPLLKSEGLVQKYGKEAAEYLSSVGYKDYGFSPNSKRAESTDVYMSKELNVKISGLSSLPSVASVLKKIVENKKLNLSDLVMKEAIDFYKAYAENPVISKDPTFTKLINTWLETETLTTIQQVRQLSFILSQMMYGILLGHSWFSDMARDEDVKSLKYSELNMPTDGKSDPTVDFTISIDEKEIKI